MNFVFETDTLTNASPATVSRLGIVYLSQEDLSVSDVILSFVDKQSEMIQYALTEYIQEYFYNGKQTYTIRNRRHLYLECSVI